ncbi:MAG TPA: TonB-dependent receptor [Pyrinomonadaceae bacterium]|nr:TonB-dependent receptor [Pyrinomonadaceae bacterium]
MKGMVLVFGYKEHGGGKRSSFGVVASLLMAVSVFSVLFLFQASTARAQTTTATIEGTVRDTQGAVIGGVQLTAKSALLGLERTGTSDTNGFYRITALPAGIYTLSASHSGFSTRNVESVELTVNRTATLDIELEVGTVEGQVSVTADTQFLNQTDAASGSTIGPRKIQGLPTNGRNYLDLMQLVPGAVINRQADTGSDNSTPVLGERSGNNNFLIDGQPNKSTVKGGAAAPFNQETIAEFQVLTAGYKAEFGQASGAVVNVITRSGGNDYHGLASIYFRNNAFDSSNSLDPAEDGAPFLQRWDYSLAMGGPVIKDKVFFFGSAERIRENRRLNFAFPDNTPQFLRDFENGFDNPSRTFETRGFLKFDEQLGRHQLSQAVNYTNGNIREFLPLSQATSLPSTRNDTGARHLLLGFADTILAGEQANPWVLTLRGGYRGDTSETRPAHPDAGVGTFLNLFSSTSTGFCCPFGDLGSFGFGNPTTRTALDEKYTSFSASAAKLYGNHGLKFGWNFLRTKVDGLESQVQQLQLFATADDFTNFGPINSGFFTVTTAGGLTPEANEIHLRNNYNGIYAQDDWKFLPNLTLNFGVRWDYDSEFIAKGNISPRIGFAWAATPKTVVRGHYGLFFDQFRLDIARDVPSFGGADRRVVQPFSYPRGFYGVPTFLPAFVNAQLFPGGLCVSSDLTDAQIVAGGVSCPFGPGLYIGIDRLNGVVAPGHAPIPANAVINVANIQALSGLTPDQFLSQASVAVGQAPGFFFFGPFGTVTHAALPPQLLPTSIDGSFKTPYTRGVSIGIQREFGKDIVVEADYYHRIMHNLLGVRESNIAFPARALGRSFLPPFETGAINTFGPWYEGKYDALVINFNKRFSRHFLLGGSYAFANETDNTLGINTLPSDSFIGIAPVVTVDDEGIIKTNQNGPFTMSTGAFVAAAGTFVNGPDLDKGPSDLSVDHTFQLNGLWTLPWDLEISGIFRAQSGFHYSRTGANEDPDGDGTFNTIDHGLGRNAFTSPPFVNLDMRFSKRFNITERFKVEALFEFFNLLNRQNPAAVETETTIATRPFGSLKQVLPGREGQVGLRIEF